MKRAETLCEAKLDTGLLSPVQERPKSQVEELSPRVVERRKETIKKAIKILQDPASSSAAGSSKNCS